MEKATLVFLQFYSHWKMLCVIEFFEEFGHSLNFDLHSLGHNYYPASQFFSCFYLVNFEYLLFLHLLFVLS